MRNITFFCLLCLASVVAHSKDNIRDLPKPKTVIVNGSLIHYIDTGETIDSKNSNTVLFVHGALGDYRTWRAQIAEISNHRRVIAYSRRFHFPNPWPESDAGGFSPSVHAEDLVSLIETLRIEGVDLVGHSLGGVVALLVARDHGALIDTLTLAEPAMVSILGRPADWKVVKEHGKTMIRPATKRLYLAKKRKQCEVFSTELTVRMCMII